MLVCWMTSFCTCARHGSLCAREQADGVSASRDLACWGRREWQKNSFPQYRRETYARACGSRSRTMRRVSGRRTLTRARA